jgi:hypothetical protein
MSTEEELIRRELEKETPGFNWPEVSMEVPEEYFKNSREAILKQIKADNKKPRNSRMYITIAAAAAVIVLVIMAQVFDVFSQEKEFLTSDWELAKYYLSEHLDELAVEDFVYVMDDPSTIELKTYEISDEEWNHILENWPYEMSEETIQKIKTEEQ